MDGITKFPGLEDLSDLLQNAAVGVHIIGKDGIILWANEIELETLGYNYEEYVNHAITEFHVDQEVISDILGRIAKGETLRDYPTRIKCKCGDIKEVLINSNSFIENGEFIHTRCFTRDITERNRLENDLKILKQTQQQLVKSAKLEAVGEMASSVAHDINHALAPIMGFSEMLLARCDYLNDKEKVRGYLIQIRSAAGDAAQVVDRLQELYRCKEEQSLSR